MKKIHRFLLRAPLPRPITEVSDEQIVHQIKRVLRLRPGERCVFFWDKGDDVTVELSGFDGEHITVREVSSTPPERDPVVRLTLAVGIAKRDTFEYVVQKASELGVAHIIPLITDHTVKTALKLDRLRAIADEALELSGGSSATAIDEPRALADVLDAYASVASYALDVAGAPAATLPHGGEAIVYIGPEGGWSDREREWFRARGISSLSLGARTLRTETAAIAAGYQFLWGAQ